MSERKDGALQERRRGDEVVVQRSCDQAVESCDTVAKGSLVRRSNDWRDGKEGRGNAQDGTRRDETKVDC